MFFKRYFVFQLSVKMTDMQSNISDISHRRQEEMQNLEKTRQEHNHVEENERYKLQNKIQVCILHEMHTSFASFSLNWTTTAG